MGRETKTSKTPTCPVPCRDKQFGEILEFVRDNIVEETSKCIYVSGVPGTGKTLIVQSVLNELKQHCPETPFYHVYVNGLTLGSNPDKIWKVLWQALNGEKLHSKKALSKLNNHFETRDIDPTVLVVDELDQLMDKRQSVLYRLLEWTNNPVSKFTFIAIFNTMNLPEMALVNRNSSRMGLSRVVFPPYDASQLQTIVESWLQSSKKQKQLKGDALVLLSKKVAAISGDARRALEIAKRTLEILESSDTPGARAVDEAFKELFSSPKVEAMRYCSDLEKTVLEAIVSELKRTGEEDINFGPVETDVGTQSTFAGKNWSRDNVIAALARLAVMKLVILDTNVPYISAFTRLSLNVPTEDVKYALAQAK